MTALRVAIVVDPYLPVPPRLYGGIERVVDTLIRGLVARGHTVDLIAHPASTAPARLHAYGLPPHTGGPRRAGELVQVGAALVGLAHRVDLVHGFGRLAALLPVLPLRRLPKLQSYGREVPWAGVARARRLAGASLRLTGCSTAMYDAAPAGERPYWSTVFNPVDTDRYTFQPFVPPDAPLAFLGRIEAGKGTHEAIDIARRAGRTLVIAGNITDQAYFDRLVAPRVDGRTVRYVGEVDDAAKDALLGAAAGLLFPIAWDEAFGIVMAEAFACGTPVIGYARGSVPEVIREGVNGFVAHDAAAAAAAVPRLVALDRRAVREDCETRFSRDVIVEAYLRLYAEALG